MKFEFATSDRIIFGAGTLAQLEEIAPGFGNRVIIVGGSGSVPMDALFDALDKSKIKYAVFRVAHEPNVNTIKEGVEKAKLFNCDFVIGFGGGSVLDSAKAIAAMMTNRGELTDYLEVIGGGKQIQTPPAPMIAIPTTAGTGTEVTKNAVISSPLDQIKVSMRSQMMIPTIAIIDPELTYSMPPSVTASTGMDALTQVIEAYVSNKANPMTDVIAGLGIIKGARALLKAYHCGSDVEARKDMALTSLCGGLALANGGLGAVHGFAGVIGGMFNTPHGVICASLLPHVLKYNVINVFKSKEMRASQSRFEQITRWVTGKPHAAVGDGVKWVHDLTEALSIPGLGEIGINRADLDTIVQKSKKSSSMQKNPVSLDEQTMKSILEEAY